MTIHDASSRSWNLGPILRQCLMSNPNAGRDTNVRVETVELWCWAKWVNYRSIMGFSHVFPGTTNPSTTTLEPCLINGVAVC